MNYLNKFKQLNTQQQYDYFIELCKDPLTVQENVLKEILEINKDCELGRKFDFASTKNIKEYQQNVPQLSWRDYEPYSLKMENGESDILFSGKTIYFTTTSGTTGKSKLIPEGECGSAIKQQISRIRDMRVISLFPDALSGKFISMSNKPIFGFTNAKIPISSASGLTTASTDKNLLKLLAFPICVKKIENQVASDYALMRFSIQEDVRGIVGNNAGRIPLLIQTAQKYADELIKDIELGTISDRFEISDEIREELKPHLKPNPTKAKELKEGLEKGLGFLPELYWKNLKIIKCWLSGSVGQYTKTLQPYIKNYNHEVVFFDAGYGSSEAKFNIPIEANTPYAPVALFGTFYEFLPANSKDGDDFLLLHQLEDKKEYQLFITTYSGLYRYNMKDIIRVDGFTHKTPNISFISKTSDIANIAGEKMYATSLQQGCFKVCKNLDIKIIHFCVVTDVKNITHKFYIELDNPQDTKSSKIIQEELFKYFCETNISYKTYQEQHLLNPLTINFMKKGWQDALYEEQEKRGLTRSQIKLPVIYNTLPLAKYLVK